MLGRCPRKLGFALSSVLVAFALLTLPGLAQAAPRPSFVVIQTDDQTVGMFNGTWVDSIGRERLIMPNVVRLLRQQGISFSSYIAPTPLCSPSRASLLSGNYAHNHGVTRNAGGSGGWPAYRSQPIHKENLAVWLQRAGYRTAHFGKFLNNYGGQDGPGEEVVPPGWDRWVTDNTDDSTGAFYGYSQNVDGVSTGPRGNPLYGPDEGRDPLGCPWFGPQTCLYHSDSISLDAVEGIRNAGPRPFYTQLDFRAPHVDDRPPAGPEPAPRHIGSAAATPRPNPPGFNERDVSDKPNHVWELEPLDRSDVLRITQWNINSIESLRSVDEAVGWVVEALRDTGRLSSTYIIFTSDNGFFQGQHRYSRGKILPYEPAIKVPMVIRGPGIRPGSTSRALVANQDIAPTLLRLAGARAGKRVDGSSMEPFWRDPSRRSRRAVLLSSYLLAPPPTLTTGSGARISNGNSVLDFIGVRVGPYKYVEYDSGEWELYDLRSDPAELRNKALLRSWTRVRLYMRSVLRDMRGCRAAECRAVQKPWPAAPSRADERRWG